MKWKKLGHVYDAVGSPGWMVSHASLPIAVQLREDLFRVHFSTRDNQGRSVGSFVDISIESPLDIIKISGKPTIVGKYRFDDFGASPSCYLENLNLVYYLGWHIEKDGLFSNQVCVAEVLPNETFKRVFLRPVLGKCLEEPYSFGDPWVLKVNGGYRMWYSVNLAWGETLSKTKFEVRSAYSQDGLSWSKDLKTCIAPEGNEEYISRPCVLLDADRYKMWYCIKKNGQYSIGYGESDNGVDWQRLDPEMIFVGEDLSWDSNEKCYPCVFIYKENTYMLYNGNNYGKTGFGLAKLLE